MPTELDVPLLLAAMQVTGLSPIETMNEALRRLLLVINDRQPESVPISLLFGSLKNKTTVRLSIEELNQAAADGWTGKLR